MFTYGYSVMTLKTRPVQWVGHNKVGKKYKHRTASIDVVFARRYIGPEWASQQTGLSGSYIILILSFMYIILFTKSWQFWEDIHMSDHNRQHYKAVYAAICNATSIFHLLMLVT